MSGTEIGQGAWLHLPVDLVRQVFDAFGDIVFCVKDREGRYVAVNQAFVDRVGVSTHEQMIGRKAGDFFPPSLVEVYDEQDAEVYSTGRPMLDELERISNPDGSIGWYLASKFPRLDSEGNVIGLVGVSQDLHSPSESDLEIANLKTLIDYIRENLDKPLRTESLARRIDMSGIGLDRRMKRVFRMSTKKFIIKCRLEEAARRLVDSEDSISDIALACGFSDQSSLTRQFRTTMSVTPAMYRRTHRNN